MNNPSISNPPTSFPTEEMKLEGAEFWHKCADRMLLDDLVSGIYLAMHKASPSTEAVERYGKALVDHNDALRAACQVADRDGKDTNWLTLRGHLHWILAEHHEITNEARAAITSLTSPAVVEDPHADEVERLKTEIARLRNIMNEDGLHDPELAKMAGKPTGVIDVSTGKSKRKFRTPANKEGA